MTHEIDRWDAEEWLQKNKDIWNHPMVTDRTDSNAYEVADLMADFANYILNKQKQKQLIVDIMNEDAKDGLYKQQTALEWLEKNIKLYGFTTEQVIETIKLFEKAKEMEKEQKNKMPIHIHEGISNTWVYIEDGVVHVKPNDLEMVKLCQFEIDNSTTSATKCKWCSQEKWQHETHGGNK